MMRHSSDCAKLDNIRKSAWCYWKKGKKNAQNLCKDTKYLVLLYKGKSNHAWCSFCLFKYPNKFRSVKKRLWEHKVLSLFLLALGLQAWVELLLCFGQHASENLSKVCREGLWSLDRNLLADAVARHRLLQDVEPAGFSCFVLRQTDGWRDMTFQDSLQDGSWWTPLSWAVRMVTDGMLSADIDIEITNRHWGPRD